jgi:hypothetical protein
MFENKNLIKPFGKVKIDQLVTSFFTTNQTTFLGLWLASCKKKVKKITFQVTLFSSSDTNLCIT